MYITSLLSTLANINAKINKIKFETGFWKTIPNHTFVISWKCMCIHRNNTKYAWKYTKLHV